MGADKRTYYEQHDPESHQRLRSYDAESKILSRHNERAGIMVTLRKGDADERD